MKIELSCILVLFSVVINTSQRSVNFTTLQVSPYNVDHDWAQIEKVIQGPPITELIFQNVLLCNEGLKRILNMKEVSQSLLSLKLDEVIVTKQIMEVLWSHPRAYSLTNLTFKIGSIEDDDLKLIPVDKELNLQAISLQSGLISAEGFQHLSKLKLNKLVNLEVYDTSLTSDLAVDSFLKMNLSSLKQLNLGFTAISEDNMMKVLNKLDLNKLTYLNISKNDFEADFYSKFATLNFSSLQTLSLQNLLIDQDGVQYLKDMRFPQLTTLSIGGNQFFIDGLYTFLSRKNFPKLKNLMIYEVIFSTSFFGYLVKEFEETHFEAFRMLGRGVEPEVLQHLKTLNFSQTRIFALPMGFMKPEIVSGFFDAADFRQLEELKIQLQVNTGDILHKVMQKVWPSLKVLRIGRIGRVNFTQLQIQAKEVRFPNLQNMAIDVRSLNISEIQKLIMLISKTWSKLIHLEMIVKSPEQIIKSLSQGLLRRLDKQILISLKEREQDEFKEVFKFMANPNSKHSIRIFNYFSILQQELSSHRKGASLEDKAFEKYYNQETKEYFQNFDYTNMENLLDQKNCSLLSYLVSDFQKKNKSCIINVRKIDLDTVMNDCYSLFNKCLFPNAHELRIGFNQTFVSNLSNFTLFPQNFSQIVFLVLRQQLNIPNIKIQDMFERQNFSNLNGFAITFSDLRSEEFELLFSKNPLLRRIRTLYIIQTYIQNLTFITNSNLKLKGLDLAAEIIGQNIQYLSQINFEFLKYWRMAGAGITNENLLALLDKLPKNQTYSFPRLQDIELHVNYIETEGNQKLFEAGMPMLVKAFIVLNKDPEIINTMLGSQKSHRLKSLQIYRNEENSIDGNLNIKNARELKKIVIQTSKLQLTDFQALSKLDFHSLESLSAQFNLIFECESLKPIRKIAYTATSISLQFQEEVGPVNTQCLSGSAKSDQNLKHLKDIGISVQSAIYSNLRNFFDLMIFDQVLQFIQIRGVYPSSQSMRRLAVQANLQYVTDIILMQNDLKDQMVQQLLNRDYTELTRFSIGSNPDLTSESIKFMRNRTYPSLKIMDLSSTRINDTGLQIILSCKFPSLQSLDIGNTQISGRILASLSNLDAPNLNDLDLSNNNFMFSDLAKFNPEKFPYLSKIYLLPYLSSGSYEKLKQMYNKNRKKTDRITLVANILNIQGNQYESEEIQIKPTP